MANIVELQENGIPQFLKTHAKAVEGLKETIVEIVYPIGCFYTSEISTAPSEILGIGVWERVKGKFLIGVDELDNSISKEKLVGGEKEHVLNISSDKDKNEIGFANVLREGLTGYGLSQSVNFTNRPAVVLDSGSNWSPKAHNNMPPYYTVYMWRRTA